MPDLRGHRRDEARRHQHIDRGMPGPPTAGGSNATLALLSFAMLIVSLDQYIVVVALSDIGRELGYSAQTLQAVVSAYAVASSGFLLFGGRAADLLGRRRMLVTGLALYAVASLAGGLATGPEVQLTARAVQGLGGALVFPSTLALITRGASRPPNPPCQEQGRWAVEHAETPRLLGTFVPCPRG